MFLQLDILVFHVSRVIEFKDKDTARKAIENMHRYKIKDRNIVVREVKVYKKKKKTYQLRLTRSIKILGFNRATMKSLFFFM